MCRIKISLLFVILLICTIILSGCVSYNNLNKYTITEGNDFINYYVFKEGNVKKEDLIIFVGGSGYGSVLGLKENGIWKETTLAYELQNLLLSIFDILVPEKKNVKMGKNHREEKKIVENYTLEQRVSTAALVIDKYLQQNEYEHIILVGFSEGGYILPKLYLNLKNKKEISGLVPLACGGLSQYESFKILKDKNYPYSEGFRKDLNRIEEVEKDIKKHPDSINRKYLGLPYKRWSSFMFYRPLDDLVKIDIPILMIHGTEDMMSPVESSRRVKTEFEKLRKENLSYIEYKDKDHGFNGEFRIIIEDIKNWFLEEIK